MGDEVGAPNSTGPGHQMELTGKERSRILITLILTLPLQCALKLRTNTHTNNACWCCAPSPHSLCPPSDEEAATPIPPHHAQRESLPTLSLLTWVAHHGQSSEGAVPHSNPVPTGAKGVPPSGGEWVMRSEHPTALDPVTRWS